MNFIESLMISLNQLMVNKLRSILSLVGILIAVGSVTGIVSLGDGLQKSIYQEFEQIGGFTTIWSWAPDPWYRDDTGRWIRRNWEEHLTFDDIEAIKAETDKVDYIIPNNSFGNLPVKRNSASIEGGQVTFSSPELLYADNLKISAGRFLTALDLIHRSKVAVIGNDIAENLFEPGENPLNKDITVGGMRYTVVGVTAPKTFFDSNYDNRTIIPVTTGQQRFIGNDYLGWIVVKAKTVDDVDDVVSAMRKVYKRRHVHGEEMEIQTGIDALAQIDRVLLIMKAVAGGIAGISLLVGGIGIMNIMLVSVTERTQEIGIRKSLGARRSSILMQFLVEAVVLCMFGGILGVGFGMLVGRGLSAFIMSKTEMPFYSVLSPTMIILAVGFSLFVGITFGVYPAWKASQLRPVEALRQE